MHSRRRSSRTSRSSPRQTDGAAPGAGEAAGLSDNLAAFTGSYTVTVATTGDVAGSLALSAPAGSSVNMVDTTGGSLNIGAAAAQTNAANAASTDITKGDLLVSDNSTLTDDGGVLNTTVLAGAGSFSVASGGTLIDSGAATFMGATVTDSGTLMATSFGFNQSTFTENSSLLTAGALSLVDTTATIAAGATANVGSLVVGAEILGFDSNLSVPGTLIDNGGVSQGASSSAGTVSVLTGGMFSVSGAFPNNVTVNFAGNGVFAETSSDTSTLQNFLGTVANLGLNNGAVNFTGLTYNSGDTTGFNASSGQLSIFDQNGTDVANLFLSGAANYVTQMLLKADAAGHLDVVVACYVTGTRLLTTQGEVAVENLRVGSHVVTATGAGRPIKWIGHRSLDLVNHPDQSAVWPVLVPANAFGENLPTRELWLSPGHNVMVDGVLVAIGRLVNGVTIVQVPRDEVTYWQLGVVSTEDHDIHLVADGVRIEPVGLADGRSCFMLPAAAADIRLASNIWVPAHALAGSQDSKILGVCVSRLQIDGVELELEALPVEGWHAVEIHGGVKQRWSGGAARLPSGARLVVVEVIGSGRYLMRRRPSFALVA